MNDELFLKHLDEYNRLIGIVQKLVDHDKPYINQLLDEILKYQPFLGSCMLGYTVDLKGAEADHVFILHLLVWAAYRGKSASRKKVVTEKEYYKIMKRNTDFFRYLEKEEGTPEFHDTIKDDSLKNNHGVLIAIISLCFQQWPALANMNNQNRGIVTAGVKSWAECFELL